jgi:hypothetical protein
MTRHVCAHVSKSQKRFRSCNLGRGSALVQGWWGVCGAVGCERNPDDLLSPAEDSLAKAQGQAAQVSMEPHDVGVS